MTIDQWQSIGVVCGALLALLTLVGLVWRRAVRPMLQGMRRAVAIVDRLGDEILGDRAKGIPSMATRMAGVEHGLAEVKHGLAEHVESHMPPSFNSRAGHRR